MLSVLLALTAAIVIVTIPAEHADESKTGTNGKPGNAKVKGAELIEHISTFSSEELRAEKNFCPQTKDLLNLFLSNCRNGTEHIQNIKEHKICKLPILRLHLPVIANR